LPLAGFEPAIPAIEWPQTYALGSSATGIIFDLPMEASIINLEVLLLNKAKI
jgi:hypothetical protein